MLEPRLFRLPLTKRGDWSIQGSVFNNESICIVAFNQKTETCLVRYFRDEEDAHKFVSNF